MLEDDRYRSSTQYRYWSYTPQALAALRSNTNAVAADRVRLAIKRVRDKKLAENGVMNSSSEDSNIDCLTVEEELKLIRWGCTKINEIGEIMEPQIPFEIRATAIQFLRRFYLTNSPMTYHPKQIMMCALFLATKTDHYHISLSRFISKLPKTTEDDIKAPEFLLMQGLRFTLDVRHPMKGLEGGFMELRAMAEGSSTGPDFVRLMQERPTRESILRKRIDAAEYYARKTLHTAAQLTDAYFLYTPSQIWLAALMIADEPLATLFLDAKMKFVGLPLEAIRPKVLDTLQSCADLLKSFNSATEESSEDREIKRIGKKLKICQNPEKLDLVEINKAQKREGADGSDAEKTLKKRKLERERLEKDGDIFGGDLKKSDSDIFGAELKR